MADKPEPNSKQTSDDESDGQTPHGSDPGTSPEDASGTEASDEHWVLDPRYLKLHQRTYVGSMIGLHLLNLVVGEGWWAFWPLLLWSVVYFFHLCLVRATHVDEDWVDERTDDLRLKSYDLGHIDDIDRRYNTGGRVGVTRRARRSQVQISQKMSLSM